ncbi:hypothetical protein C9374_000510 [Naegleria lovaniensis]|uniref:ODAD1 central coiled coil region domain-containing protein n=1 Tax=Naegleria lovaniensis TaxID=51637 RepID=A0AA88KP72_NAELO|nr:uncharacterized protein C9374_000510 [Naegleria lovaniensis]KAG2388346.1 hypothetical protein C9374_000510 [Naegleria lovaniensis]
MSKYQSHSEAILEMQDKLNLLDGDRERKATLETKQKALQKNNDTLEMVKKENKDLKESLKKLQKEVGGNNGEKTFQQKEFDRLETILHLKRQEFDELLAIAQNLQKTIRKKEDILNDFNKEKAPILTDDSPLTRQIRILENRLDKAMIKYNEAQSIKKTYEQILERLKEERIGFDNQLQAIERTLRSKDKDYVELLNMSRDANYLRELAKNELAQATAEFEESVKELRKELDEKKKYVEARVNLTTDLAKKEATRRRNQDDEGSRKNRSSSSSSQQMLGYSKSGPPDEDRDRLQVLEEKWRKLKEVTGVDDVNEVIQKFLSSSDTHKNLEQMTKDSQKRIEHLTEKKANLKTKLEDLKYSQSSGLGSRRIVDEFIQQLSESQSKNERQKQQFERIAKILVNVKAGAEHLNDKMSPALVELTLDETLRKKFIEEIARGEDMTVADDFNDTVSMSTVSLGTQSNEERHIVNLLAQCYVNVSSILDSLPSEEEMFQDALRNSDSLDFNQSRNNIRIKLSEEVGQDSESEDEDDDKEAELISRMNVKKKAEKILKTKVVKK